MNEIIRRMRSLGVPTSKEFQRAAMGFRAVRSESTAPSAAKESNEWKS